VGYENRSQQKETDKTEATTKPYENISHNTIQHTEATKHKPTTKRKKSNKS
jgi:hypothetical protein